MQVQCKHCQARLSIPDDKIPKGQKVAITCPKCKQKFQVAAPAPKPQVQAMDDGAGYEYRDVDEVLQLTFEEGEKLVLAMLSQDIDTEKIREAAEDLGFRFIVAENTRDALSKMRFHHFEMVLLCDNFDGISLDQSPVMNYMNHLPMSSRRKIFLVLFGDDFNSMDHMKAFALSTNLVVNKKDIGKLTPILKRALADHEIFYKVFMETLVEVGKA